MNKKILSVLLVLSCIVTTSNTFLAFAHSGQEPLDYSKEIQKIKTKIESIKKNPPDVSNEIQEIKTKLETIDNKILYSKLKMLEHKYPGLQMSTSSFNNNLLSENFGMTSISSPLIYDLYGGISKKNNNLLQGIDLLTGERAIKESLQLESIGTERDNSDQNLVQDVSFALENYKKKFGQYPQSLEDFRNVDEQYNYFKNIRYSGNPKTNIADIANKFDYSVQEKKNVAYINKINDTLNLIPDDKEEELVKLNLRFKASIKTQYGFKIGSDPNLNISNFPQLEYKNNSKDTVNTVAIIYFTERTRSSEPSLFTFGIYPETLCPSKGNDFNKNLTDKALATAKTSTIDAALKEMLLSINECYEPTGKDQIFTLTLKKEESLFELKDIKPLEIKSHPWDEMLGSLKEKSSPSDIFKLVPEDHFAAYFNDIDKFDQLEKTMKSFTDTIDIVFNLNNMESIKEKVLETLGIKKFENLSGLVEEFALVSSNIDFYPGTSFALILKFKSDLAQSLLESFDSEKNVHEKVGDYYVISTHAELLNAIKLTYGGEKKSLLDAKDFLYTWNVLEQRRDGMIYFSENFIRKLIGPEHRIKSSRRNTAVRSLETLQYMVFAYRNITKAWPKSIQTMADEDYIDISKIKKPRDFSVDENGKVHHAVWGSLYNMTPVENVDLKEITSAEKHTYEQFTTGYQSFWKEFFDPIGVAFSIGDQIMLHTIILPLIEESDYKEMENFIGGEPIEFEFLSSPQRIAATGVYSKFNFEEILFKIGQEMTYSEYRNESYDKKIPYDKQQKEKEYLKAFSRDDIIEKVEKKWFEEIGWKKNVKARDLFGGEIMLGIGEKNRFTINNIANLDTYIGIRLKDSATVKELLELSMKTITDKYGSHFRPPVPGFGFFELSLEPIKNEYNGVEYFTIPMGFVNFFYTFLNGNMYVTISQVALNNLIDGPKKMKEEQYGTGVQRGIDYIGSLHNILFNADLKKIENWRQDVSLKNLDSRIVDKSFNPMRSYLDEALTLSKSLPNYDDKLSNVDGIYYRNIPATWMVANVYIENGIKKMNYGEKIYEMDDINAAEKKISMTTFVPDRTDYYRKPDEKNNKNTQTIALADVIKDFDVKEIFKSWDSMENLTIGFAFIKEGISTKVAFKNSATDEFDERFKGGETKKFSFTGFIRLIKKYQFIILSSVMGLGVLIVLTLIIKRMRRKKGEKIQLHEPSETQPPMP